MECGDNFQPHLQGYFEFDRTRRLAYLKAHIHPTCHFEPRGGTRAQAVAYCTKDDTRVEDPVFYGDLDVTQGSRSDLHECCMVVANEGMGAAIDQFPEVFVKYHRGLRAYAWHQLKPRRAIEEDRPNVTFLWGPTGCGKTRRAYEIGSDSVYPKDPSNRWWDGYVGQETIVIDDYTNSSQNGLNTDYMLRLLDIYPMILEVKGDTIPISRTTRNIVITSNLNVEALWPSHTDAIRRRIRNEIHLT